MQERDDKLKRISDELNENIIAIRSTLELIEAFISEEDLKSLILKAIERMEAVQKLSNDTVIALKGCFDKIDELTNKQ